MTQNRRFQHGSLFKRGTRTKVWVARWWEEAIGPDGQTERVRRSEVLGLVAEIPTRREAEQLRSERLRPVNQRRLPSAIELDARTLYPRSVAAGSATNGEVRDQEPLRVHRQRSFDSSTRRYAASSHYA